jgi:hypothetical protein
MASAVAASGECGEVRACDEVATGKGGGSDAKAQYRGRALIPKRGAEGSRITGEKGAAGVQVHGEGRNEKPIVF